VVAFEVLLVYVGVRVDVIAVVVLVRVLDVIVVLRGMPVVMGDVAVLVLMAVAVLRVLSMAGLGVSVGLACGEGVRSELAVLGAGSAQADDRKMAEARLVAEGLEDRGAHAV